MDFILGDGEVCIEVKGSDLIKPSEMRGINAFKQEHRPNKAIVVCNERESRLSGDIIIMPWRFFLEELWNGDIVR